MMSTISHSSILVNLLFLLALLQQFLSQSTAQTYMNMTRNTELSPSGPISSIASRSGDFAFGFRPTNQSHFLLAIWFNATSPQPIIWFATTNDRNPVLVSAKASFLLNNAGSLSLTDPANLLWNPDLTDAEYANLSDEGNLILYDGNGSPMWGSFQYPTDTIVPGQSLYNGSQLWSKLTDSDFSKGRFTLAVQPDGNVVIYPLSLPSYDRYTAIWSSGTYEYREYFAHNAAVLLVFNSNGSLYIQISNFTFNVTAAPNFASSEYYQHATLDPDGIFRVYVYAKRPVVSEWKVVGQHRLDGCRHQPMEGAEHAASMHFATPAMPIKHV